SFSSRAAAAIALTASNSSRPTKSLPAIHSRIFSRADASASRPIPANVPAKPFTIFTKSSNTLFSDCIEQSPFRRGNRGSGTVPPPWVPDLSPSTCPIPSFLGAEQELDVAFGAGDRALRDAEHCPALRGNPRLGLRTDALMHGRIADDAPLPYLLAPRLKLRFDERDQPCSGSRECQRRLEHLGETDEARIANHDVHRLGNDVDVEIAGIGLFMHYHPRVLPKLPRELGGPDIHRIDLRRTAREQHVRETAGRAAHVQRDSSGHIKPEMSQSMIELDPTARDPRMIL